MAKVARASLEQDWPPSTWRLRSSGEKGVRGESVKFGRGEKRKGKAAELTLAKWSVLKWAVCASCCHTASSSSTLSSATLAGELACWPARREVVEVCSSASSESPIAPSSSPTNSGPLWSRPKVVRWLQAQVECVLLLDTSLQPSLSQSLLICRCLFGCFVWLVWMLCFLWSLFGCFWLHFGHFLDAFWLLFGHFLPTFRWATKRKESGLHEGTPTRANLRPFSLRKEKLSFALSSSPDSLWRCSTAANEQRSYHIR